VTNHDTGPGGTDCCSVTAALGAPILAVDAAGAVVYANERAVRGVRHAPWRPRGSGLEAIGEFVDGDPEPLLGAVRHSDRARPRVTVTVDTPGAGEQRARCTVAHDGPVTPATERSAVEPGREGQRSHGTGCGLPRIHWTVTDHGDEVSIRDRSPRGTLVELSLPRGETPRS
jgi:nitrogen-specific signal transduction histidine kinase